jgi:hypothetical protein
LIWAFVSALPGMGKAQKSGSQSWLPRRHKGTEAIRLLTAVGCIIAFLPLFPGVFMGDGTKSVAIRAAAFPLLPGAVLPAVDGLLVRPPARK